MKNKIALWMSFIVIVVFIAMYVDLKSDIQAANQAGQAQTVCGYVASTYYGSQFKAKDTYLNLGKPFPKQKFTGIIEQKDRSNFPVPPENEYQGKNICITGIVEYHKGRPEIAIHSKAQITTEYQYALTLSRQP